MNIYRWEIRGQYFTTDELETAGRVLGVLGDDVQDRAIAALRSGEFEKAKDEQRIADILHHMKPSLAYYGMRPAETDLESHEQR